MTAHVTVFGDSEREVCLISGCGSQTSSSDAWPETAAALKDLFGDRLALRYYDLSDPTLRARFADVLDGARQRGLRFPLVAVNGVVVAGTDEATPYPLTVERMLALINAAL